MGVHLQQVDRLKKANEDIGQIASLQESHLRQLRQELELTPLEWARLQAGIEADMFFRLLLYHNYPLEEAANRANAVFALTLKDRLDLGGKSDAIYPVAEPIQAAPKQLQRARSRKQQATAPDPEEG